MVRALLDVIQDAAKDLLIAVINVNSIVLHEAVSPALDQSGASCVGKKPDTNGLMSENKSRLSQILFSLHHFYAVHHPSSASPVEG